MGGQDPFDELKKALERYLRFSYRFSAHFFLFPLLFGVVLFVYAAGVVPRTFEMLWTLLGFYFVASFCLAVVLYSIATDKEQDFEDKFDLVSHILPSRFWEASTARAFDNLLGRLMRNIQQIYPEVPEDRVMTFLNDFLRELNKIYEKHDDENLRRELALLSFKRLSKKHKIPLVLNVVKDEVYNNLGGAVWLFYIKRVDADEVAILKQIKESMRLWAKKEE